MQAHSGDPAKCLESRSAPQARSQILAPRNCRRPVGALGCMGPPYYLGLTPQATCLRPCRAFQTPLCKIPARLPPVVLFSYALAVSDMGGVDGPEVHEIA